MDLEGIMLSERERQILCYHLYAESKNKMSEYNKTEADSYIENK